MPERGYVEEGFSFSGVHGVFAWLDYATMALDIYPYVLTCSYILYYIMFYPNI
jgi:hypothetical protein